PSTKLSTDGRKGTLAAIAKLRRTEPGKLAKMMRGELDWIVMKSLEKDRSRRYPTSSELALDVERYLAGEPVQAVPPSTVYRLRKWVGRHRSLALGGTLLFLAMLVGIIGTTFGLLQADRARDQAVSAEQRLVFELEQANNARLSSDAI